jgi:hypothetical protein
MPAPPFTRLPTTPVQSDLYDKVQAVGATVDQNNTALTNGQATLQTGLATVQSQLSALQTQMSTPGAQTQAFRTSGVSTGLTASDYTLYFVITFGGPALCPLPPTTPPAGQIFVIKNAAASMSNVTLQAANKQTIDGAAATSYVLAPGNCLTIQSDGTNYLLLSRI